MSRSTKRTSRSRSPAELVTYLHSTPPSWLREPAPVPSAREVEFWALVREVDHQRNEVARLKHDLRWYQWAIGELVDYLDAELKPGQLTSWQRYKRLISRLRKG